MDIIKMPSAAGHKNLILARDNLSCYIEGRALQTPSAKAMAKFF
jgi:hypothetical protein